MDEIGGEAIFTRERCEVIASVNCSELSETEAGFVMSVDGKPNVIFNVMGGNLAITGIN